MLKKVISGGQTGVDQLGIIIAKHYGIETGGTAAKGWWTEDGAAPWLEEYGLVECKEIGYPPRTRQNVKDSDGTVVFGKIVSPGSKETILACRAFKKPYLPNPEPAELADWIKRNGIKTLNVAGNRKSKLTEEYKNKTIRVLSDYFSTICQNALNPTTQQ